MRRSDYTRTGWRSCGGFPKSYPGTVVPELEAYFDVIREAAALLPLADDAEVLGEPDVRRVGHEE